MAAANNRTQAKRWCFTINNPEDPEYEGNGGLHTSGDRWFIDEHYHVDPYVMDHLEIQYLVCQEERGEGEGTLHLQGFVIFKTKKTLAWLKRTINQRAHWEVTRGSNQQAAEYCKKQETRAGRQWEWGELPTRAPTKAAERLAAAAEAIDEVKEGYKRPSEFDSLVLLQPGFIQAYTALTNDVLGDFRPELSILTMVGPPGCGKSTAWFKHLGKDHGLAIYGNNGCWFANPRATTMVFEEFCGQIPLQRMLHLLDPFPQALEVKGRMVPACYTKVIITSNTPPDAWYKETDAKGEPDPKRIDAIHALWDRLGYSNGSYIPARRSGTYLTDIPGTIEQKRRWFDEQVAEWIDMVDNRPPPHEFEHEDLPDSPPSEDDQDTYPDTQEERRMIGY